MAKKEPEIIHYNITNWDKYQKNDTRYFIRLQNDIFRDPAISQLTAPQFKLYIVLLTTSGRQNRVGMGTILLTNLRFEAGTRGSSCKYGLAKLVELGLIEIQKERKNRKREKVIKKVSEKKVFLTDQKLDELYASYPKKLGKKKGNEKLKKIVTNEKELLNFEAAIKNYKKEISANETASQYQKHYSTFVNCYEDYVSGALTDGRVQSDRLEDSAALKRLRESGINDDILD